MLNGEAWVDSDANRIEAHGGCILSGTTIITGTAKIREK